MSNHLLHSARNPSLDRDRPAATPRPECAPSVNGLRAANLLQQAGNLPSEFGEAGTSRDTLRVAGAVFRAPRFTDQPYPVRRPPVADVSAPGEGGPPPLDSPGAAHSVLTVTLPDSALLLLRLIGAHDGVEDEGAIITRLVVARAEKIGIAALADASTPVSKEGREGVPSGAFPLPQGPP